MKLSCSRGAATVVVIAAVALIGLGGFMFSKNPSTQHQRWQFWRKTPATLAANADSKAADAKAAEAKLQAGIDEKTRELIGKAQESATAADVAAGATVNAIPAGAPGAREAVTTKTLTSQTVQQLGAATGETIDPKRVRELETMVADLNADRAAGRAALTAMQTSYDAELAQRRALEARLTEAEAKTLAAEQTAQEANRKAQAWGAERDAVASRYETLQRGAIALVVVSLALSIWLFGARRVASAATNTATDLVALVEHIKGEYDKAAPGKLSELKGSIKHWIGEDGKLTATIEQIKSQLRR